MRVKMLRYRYFHRHPHPSLGLAQSRYTHKQARLVTWRYEQISQLQRIRLIRDRGFYPSQRKKKAMRRVNYYPYSHGLIQDIPF